MKTLILLMILSLLATPVARGNAVAEGAQTVSTAVNTSLGAIQMSQAQLQAMQTQMTNLNGQQGSLSQAQMQMGMITGELSNALATAKQCMDKGKKDVSKYKKATLTPTALDNAIPTCSNYGKIIDSARKFRDLIDETNTNIACIGKFQGEVNRIAESSKQTFLQMNKAAMEIWNTRDKIIKNHEDIAGRLDKALNDPDTGYKKQLADLKKMNTEVGNAIAQFSAQIRGLKQQRVQAANNWYYQIMGKVQACYANDVMECGRGATSAMGCVQAFLRGNPKTGAQHAAAAYNLQNLSTRAVLNIGDIKSTTAIMAKVDTSKPEEFKAVVQDRFEKMLARVMANFNSMELRGGVSKDALISAVNRGYRHCYDKAMQEFTIETGINGGNPVLEEEKALTNNVRNLMNAATDSMESFGTSFNKIYNREMTQFSANCASVDSSNPYESLDCLKKISVVLSSGLSGTRQNITLDNGDNFTNEPAPTILNMESMVIGQDGKPTIATQQMACVGYNECMVTFDKALDHHKTQAESQITQRNDFVTQHNTNVDTIMTAITSQFSGVSQLMGSAIQNLSGNLTALGVTGTNLTTKTVEGEALTKDENTGIYNTPTSMKAALAGTGSIMELDPESVSTAVTAMNERIASMSAKNVEAAVMKGLCIIKEGDKTGITNNLTCDLATVCTNQFGRVLGPLESLLHKSQNEPDKDTRRDAKNNYASCESRALDATPPSTTLADLADATTAKLTPEQLDQMKQDKLDEFKDKQNQRLATCATDAMADLDTLAGNARTSMKSSVDKILSHIRSMNASCAAGDEESAATHCKAAKKATTSTKLPTDEEETKTDSDSKTNNYKDPLSGTAR